MNHDLIRILLLEDSATDAELVQYFLRKNYRTCEFDLAMTEREFDEKLESFKPHVVLADNSLPQFDAATALAKVRSRYRDLAFIMVTGTVSEEFAAAIIREGADDYILKDRLARLPAAIDAALHKHRQEAEKRGALQQLIRSEEKYRSLVEQISDGFLSLDENWQVTYVNTVAEQLLGKAKGTLLGKNLWTEFPQAIDGVFYRAFHDSMREQRTIFLTDYSPATDRWFEGTVYPSPHNVAVYFRDVTNEKRAREDARRSEEKFRVFIERITDAFISVDHNWRINYLNPQAAVMNRRPAEEMIGRNIWEVFPDAVGSSTYKAFHTAMREQRFISNMDYYAPLDLWQENHIYPSPDGLSVFIRDISEKKRLERELREQERKSQLEKISLSMAAEEKVRNLIGAELHDNVNQLLASANVYLSVIRDKPIRVEELIHHCIASVKKAIHETRRLAHELVAPDLQSETLLSQVFLLCETMLQPAGIACFVKHDQFNESLVSQDKKLALYRILQEQCTNILKYAEATNVWIQFETHSSQRTIMQVKDNGKGMEAEAHRTGIGLRNMATRLEVFGGSMEIVTGIGQGFLLEIILPA